MNAKAWRARRHSAEDRRGAARALDLRAIAFAAVSITSMATACMAQDRPTTPTAPPSDLQKRVDLTLQKVLKDPYSAVVTMSRPPRYDTFRIGQLRRTGWGVCYSVNAKNAYGAYTGGQQYLFIVPQYGRAELISPMMLPTYANAVIQEQIESECRRRWLPSTPPAEEQPPTAE